MCEWDKWQGNDQWLELNTGITALELKEGAEVKKKNDEDKAVEEISDGNLSDPNDDVITKKKKQIQNRAAKQKAIASGEYYQTRLLQKVIDRLNTD